MTSPNERLSAALAGRYRIERELGQGGMATVFLAADLKHDRQVAIKVLRPELAAVIGAERFLREIKTIAGLQHPHILGLIDSGEMDGTAFYVMPFVEGESLRERLQREKQLSIPDAIRVASEVASALDYAHRRGIIHRDIKPENILLHDGQALVADFGIALAVSTAGGTRMTETGMSLGTPHYMSPEQALGEREITARADVYALGCVLYEMLVGEPPFTGPTAQAIIAKVMADEPRAPSQLRKTVPASLDHAVLTALAKIPADRFPTAAALGDALRAPPSDVAGITIPRAVPHRAPSVARRITAGAAWAALGAAAAAALLWRPRPESSGSPERQQVTYSGLAFAPAISADGKFVAYIEFKCPQPPARGGCANLHVLEVGSARPVEILAGADRLSSPRWTHDGLALVVAGALAGGGVGAVVRSGLFTIPRLGGIPRRLADDPVAFDTHASADSVAFLVEGDSGSTLRVMNVASGTAGTSHRIDVRPLDVAWSPDGRMFAISSYDQIYVFSRDGLQLSRTTRTVTRDNLRWSVDGRHILSFQWTAAQGDDFVAFPVNADGRLERPRLLASQEQTLLRGQFDVARRTGRVVIGSGSEFHDIWSFDLAAAPVKARRITQGTNWYGPPALTSDGRSLYYLRADPLGNNIYRMVDGVETPLTAERQVVNNSLRLAHNDSVVTFESRFDSVHALVVYDIASGTARRVSRGPEEFGWVIPGHRGIVWFAPFEPALFITDSAGGNRRNVAVTALGDQQRVFTRFFEWGNWFLAPDGESVAIVGGNRDVATVYRVSVRGGAATELVRFPRSEGVTGLAGWGRDGMIHVARGDPSSGGTALLRIDAASGAFRGSVVLPAPCNPAGVTVATQGRRAACEVIERRADLMILDGIRP